jgi:hypothetical protein
MDTMMDGLKGDIMEGSKKFLIERPPESENVSMKFMMRTQGR